MFLITYGTYSYQRGDETIFVYRAPFFCQWYLLLIERENITMSPKIVQTDHSAFQLRFLSIPSMNVWLWNSDAVFAVALVNCFSYGLKFWILRPSISKWFSPIRHFAKADSAFRTVLQKEFGSRPCFLFRHVSRTFVILHRQRTPSCFCTVTAAHSPLFC